MRFLKITTASKKNHHVNIKHIIHVSDNIVYLTNGEKLKLSNEEAERLTAELEEIASLENGIKESVLTVISLVNDFKNQNPFSTQQEDYTEQQEQQKEPDTTVVQQNAPGTTNV